MTKEIQKNPQANNIDLSIVTITLNEADRIPKLFDSLPKGAELICIDSGSTDQTVAIARSYGAIVVEQQFLGFGPQKNVGISLATRPWVLVLDADEALTPEFVRSLKNAREGVCYRIERRLVFMGRKLLYGRSRDFPVRLFPRGTAVYEKNLHETIRTELPIRRLGGGGYVEHFSYRSIEDYFSKFNRYTSLLSENKNAHAWQAVLRFFLDFLNRYFFRGGFRDGFPGFTYALFGAVYSFTKYAKSVEKKYLDLKF